jgi:hypothetical protein
LKLPIGYAFWARSAQISVSHQFPELPCFVRDFATSRAGCISL